jgi:hypothetical protein
LNVILVPDHLTGTSSDLHLALPPQKFFTATIVATQTNCCCSAHHHGRYQFVLTHKSFDYCLPNHCSVYDCCTGSARVQETHCCVWALFSSKTKEEAIGVLNISRTWSLLCYSSLSDGRRIVLDPTPPLVSLPRRLQHSTTTFLQEEELQWCKERSYSVNTSLEYGPTLLCRW